MKTYQKTLVGVGAGFVAGCVYGATRAAITVCAPWMWVPGSALTLGGLAHEASEGNVPVTLLAGAAGTALGVVELACYPVTAPLSLLEAACLPVIGAVVGGVIEYQN